LIRITVVLAVFLSLAVLQGAEDDPATASRPDNLPALLPLGFYAIPNLDQLDETLSIQGFLVLPMGDLSAGGKAIEFHPKASLGSAWDSNPLQARDGSSADVYEQWGAGCELRLQGEDGWLGDLDGMLRGRSYLDHTRETELSGFASGRVQRQGKNGQFFVRASYLHASDPSFNKPDTVKRESSTAAVGGSTEGRLDRWSASADITELRFPDSTTEPDKRLVSLNGAWYRLGGSGSRLGIELSGETADLTPNDHATGYQGGTVQGVWKHAFGSRSALELAAGGMLRQHEHATDSKPANDDATMLAPALAARLLWSWEEKSWLSVSATSGLADSIAGNANASQRLGVITSLRLRLLDRLDLDTLGWVIKRRDSATGYNGIHETAFDIALRSGVEYRIRDGLGLRTYVLVERHDFTSDNDYQRQQIVLEVFASL